MTAPLGRSDRSLQKTTSAAGTHISPCQNTSHNYLALGQWHIVSAIKPYEGFGDVDHTIKELMSL
jgi:hypothetical protein